MKKVNVFIIIGFVVILSIILSSIAFFSLLQEKKLHTEVIHYDYVVMEELGMILDNDILHFGGLMPGARSERSISVGVPFDADVVIEVVKNNSEIVTANPGQFSIIGGTAVDVMFSLVVDEGTPHGEYTGKILLHFFRKI